MDRLKEEAELTIAELACWFLFHQITVVLAFWAGVSYGKRIELVAHTEAVQKNQENVLE